MRRSCTEVEWFEDYGVGDEFLGEPVYFSNKWERFHPTDYLPADKVKGASIYQVMADSKNNLWMAEFTEGHLGKIDARTTEVTWYATPTAHARARRLQIDDQDRVLLTEYRTSKVAQFDPKTEKFIEYSLPEY